MQWREGPPPHAGIISKKVRSSTSEREQVTGRLPGPRYSAVRTVEGVGGLPRWAGHVVLTVLVAPGQELQVVNVVVVITRGPQHLKRQVSYDWRRSAKDAGEFISEEAQSRPPPGGCTPSCRVWHAHSVTNAGASLLKNKGRKVIFPMVETKEALFSEVLIVF